MTWPKLAEKEGVGSKLELVPGLYLESLLVASAIFVWPRSSLNPSEGGGLAHMGVVCLFVFPHGENCHKNLARPPIFQKEIEGMGWIRCLRAR